MSLHRPLQSIQTATQIVLGLLVVALLECGWITTAAAAPLEIQVLDKAGDPVRDAVVTVSDGKTEPGSAATAANRRMVMDQINMLFLPQVLLVPVGASVSFPNSDTVSHQVYSFSRAKTFQLPLYKGITHAPILFDKPGLVVLGCNIHDSMVGYIYVTDAHWFGQTDAQGKLNLNNVTAGQVTVTVWSPLIADPPATLTRTVQVADSGIQNVVFKLIKALRSSPEPKPRRSDWDY